MIAPRSHDLAEQGLTILPADSLANRLCHVSAPVTRARCAVDCLDDVLGQKQGHPHSHAYIIEHKATRASGRRG